MTALDTSEQAARVQLDIQRRMGPAERIRLAVEMSDATFDLAKTGIRFRHPEYTEARVVKALLHALYGFEKELP